MRCSLRAEAAIDHCCPPPARAAVLLPWFQARAMDYQLEQVPNWRSVCNHEQPAPRESSHSHRSTQGNPGNRGAPLMAAAGTW
jgi:hypothetical protein